MCLLGIIYKEIKKRMTYKIDYETKEGKWQRVFDIEFSLTYSESNRTKKEWYSEIDVAPCVEGLIWLARDLDSSKIEEFVRDSAVISELRAELYEGGELWRGLISHNEPTYIDVAEQRHYHELKPIIEQRLREYCEKYNLSLNVD